MGDVLGLIKIKAIILSVATRRNINPSTAGWSVIIDQPAVGSRIITEQF